MLSDLPDDWIARAGSAENAVLLETRRFDSENFRSYLFTHPRTVLQATEPDEVMPLLADVERECRRGSYAAGYLAYEAGYAGEEIGPLPSAGYPLAWFGIYDHPEIFDHRADAPAAPSSGTFQAPIDRRRLRLQIGLDDYRDAVTRIHGHIREGDAYQVNFTSAFTFPAGAGAGSLYAALRQGQRVACGGLLRAGNLSILSFSPELFFRLRGSTITTRPMKGTARRGRTLEEDEEQRSWLRNDPKNRSENIMIVDLLRNDLGRICRPGSVRTTELCTVEKFETLFQMTSAVEGELLAGTTLQEIFRCLFPSGSVTGAPKIRAMQIINSLEPRARGVYTGAIGFVTPERDAVFNVAIRTAVLQGDAGSMGTGSGIVIDSDPDEEYAECLLKGRFLTEAAGEFQLIETMLWDGRVYPLLRYHLARFRASAAYFDFSLDEEAFHETLRRAAAAVAPGQRSRIRLLLGRDGSLSTEATPLTAGASAPLRIALAPEPVSSGDVYLFHKTTRRALYDDAFARARALGFADALFVNERGEVTECTRSNIFLLRGNHLVTPPASCGLLRGVYRSYLLETSRVNEEILTPADLASADALYLSNAVHGLRPAAFVVGARLPRRDASPALHGTA